MAMQVFRYILGVASTGCWEFWYSSILTTIVECVATPLPPSAGTVTVDCTTGASFSAPEAEVPEFTLSCTSSGGPVRGFNCTSPGGGNIVGVASLRNPVDATNKDQGIYDHSVDVTVTGNYQGEYTCQVTMYRYDGIAPEPEMVYPAAQTITVTGELVNISLSMALLSCMLTIILPCLSCCPSHWTVGHTSRYHHQRILDSTLTHPLWLQDILSSSG